MECGIYTIYGSWYIYRILHDVGILYDIRVLYDVHISKFLSIQLLDMLLMNLVWHGMDHE